MSAIYKYKLNGVFPISQVTARIIKPLWVDYQNGEPYLWAVVGDDCPERTISVLCIGTGHPIPETMPLANYLNTTVYQSEPYVWHWFWIEAKG